MNYFSTTRRTLTAALFLAFLFLLPAHSYAAGKAADAVCTAGDYTCPCGWKDGECTNKNKQGQTCMQGRPCQDSLVTGECTKVDYCEGEECIVNGKPQKCEKTQGTQGGLPQTPAAPPAPASPQTPPATQQPAVPTPQNPQLNPLNPTPVSEQPTLLQSTNPNDQITVLAQQNSQTSIFMEVKSDVESWFAPELTNTAVIKPQEMPTDSFTPTDATPQEPVKEVNTFPQNSTAVTATTCDWWCTTKDVASGVGTKIADGFDYTVNNIFTSSADARPAASVVQQAVDGQTIQGSASVYDPTRPGESSGGMSLSTGGTYNPNTYSAALQTDIALATGCGAGAGNTCYALVQSGDKAEIVQINDNGPLYGNRIIDLNTKSMNYFTGGGDTVLNNVQVSLLSGSGYTPGPVGTGYSMSASDVYSSMDWTDMPLSPREALGNIVANENASVAGAGIPNSDWTATQPSSLALATVPPPAEQAPLDLTLPITPEEPAPVDVSQSVSETRSPAGSVESAPLSDITPNYAALIPQTEPSPVDFNLSAFETARPSGAVQSSPLADITPDYASFFAPVAEPALLDLNPSASETALPAGSVTSQPLGEIAFQTAPGEIGNPAGDYIPGLGETPQASPDTGTQSPAAPVAPNTPIPTEWDGQAVSQTQAQQIAQTALDRTNLSVASWSQTLQQVNAAGGSITQDGFTYTTTDAQQGYQNALADRDRISGLMTQIDAGVVPDSLKPALAAGDQGAASQTIDTIIKWDPPLAFVLDPLKTTAEAAGVPGFSGTVAQQLSAAIDPNARAEQVTIAAGNTALIFAGPLELAATRFAGVGLGASLDIGASSVGTVVQDSAGFATNIERAGVAIGESDAALAARNAITAETRPALSVVETAEPNPATALQPANDNIPLLSEPRQAAVNESPISAPESGGAAPTPESARIDAASKAIEDLTNTPSDIAAPRSGSLAEALQKAGSPAPVSDAGVDAMNNLAQEIKSIPAPSVEPVSPSNIPSSGTIFDAPLSDAQGGFGGPIRLAFNTDTASVTDIANGAGKYFSDAFDSAPVKTDVAVSPAPAGTPVNAAPAVAEGTSQSSQGFFVNAQQKISDLWNNLTGKNASVAEVSPPLTQAEQLPLPLNEPVQPPRAAPIEPTLQSQQLELPLFETPKETQLELPLNPEPKQLALPLNEPVQPPLSPVAAVEPQQLELPLQYGRQLELPLGEPVQGNATAQENTIVGRWDASLDAKAITAAFTLGGLWAVAPSPATTVDLATPPAAAAPALATEVAPLASPTAEAPALSPAAPIPATAPAVQNGSEAEELGNPFDSGGQKKVTLTCGGGGGVCGSDDKTAAAGGTPLTGTNEGIAVPKNNPQGFKIGDLVQVQVGGKVMANIPVIDYTSANGSTYVASGLLEKELGGSGKDVAIVTPMAAIPSAPTESTPISYGTGFQAQPAAPTAVNNPTASPIIPAEASNFSYPQPSAPSIVDASAYNFSYGLASDVIVNEAFGSISPSPSLQQQEAQALIDAYPSNTFSYGLSDGVTNPVSGTAEMNKLLDAFGTNPPPPQPQDYSNFQNPQADTPADQTKTATEQQPQQVEVPLPKPRPADLGQSDATTPVADAPKTITPQQSAINTMSNLKSTVTSAFRDYQLTAGEVSAMKQGMSTAMREPALTSDEKQQLQAGITYLKNNTLQDMNSGLSTAQMFGVNVVSRATADINSALNRLRGK